MKISQNSLFCVFDKKIAYVHVFLKKTVCSYEETNCVLNTSQGVNVFGQVQKVGSGRIFFQKDMNFSLRKPCPVFEGSSTRGVIFMKKGDFFRSDTDTMLNVYLRGISRITFFLIEIVELDFEIFTPQDFFVQTLVLKWWFSSF